MQRNALVGSGVWALGSGRAPSPQPIAALKPSPQPRALSLLMLGLLMLLSSVELVMAAEPAQQTTLPFRYDAKDRRDPFVPLVKDGRLLGTIKGSVDTSKPMLRGILWDPNGHSLALLNDGEYKVGEAIGEYQVMEIRKDAVVLSNGGESLVLQITFEPAPAGHSSDATTGGEAP